MCHSKCLNQDESKADIKQDICKHLLGKANIVTGSIRCDEWQCDYCSRHSKILCWFLFFFFKYLAWDIQIIEKIITEKILVS